MINTIHFFASREDLCNIFNAVEQEFDIKYCIESADKEVVKDEMPKMEFDTIEEIADDCNAAHLMAPHYLIAPKTEVMKTEWHMLRDRDDKSCAKWGRCPLWKPPQEKAIHHPSTRRISPFLVIQPSGCIYRAKASRVAVWYL